MRKILVSFAISFLAVAIPLKIFAQGVGINLDGTNPDNSAILDVKSTAKGLLVPRMTTIQRIAITSPATGLLVYDTNTSSFWYYNGTSWMNFNNGWGLNGNSGTDPATHFIGTTDNVGIVVKVKSEISGMVNAINTGWGFRALANNVSGSYNVAFGIQGLFINNTGYQNTAIGSFTLDSNTTGYGNTGVGCSALFSSNTAIENSATGSLALYFNTTGSHNTAIGYGALFNNVIGSTNVAIGERAMLSVNSDFNTGLGAHTEVSGPTITNATAIGFSAFVNASNKVRIGNGAVTVIEGQVPFTTPSDGRFKYNVKEDVKGLDFILQLRPVTYQFDVKKFDTELRHNSSDSLVNVMQASYDQASAIRRTGFIAQEVETAAAKTGYNFSGIIKPQTPDDHYSLSYESFVVPLVKAVQEQQQEIDQLKELIRTLQKQVTDSKK